MPCGYVYDEEEGDPDNGIAPGTNGGDLPEDWVCPVCGLAKVNFQSFKTYAMQGNSLHSICSALDGIVYGDKVINVRNQKIKGYDIMI